jgi:hypothetical protein
MRYWAFNANPDYFDVERALAETDEGPWITGRSKVSRGDRAIIWKSYGNDRNGDERRRGVVALAEVLTDPEVTVAPSPYWRQQHTAPDNRVNLRFVRSPLLPAWDGEVPAELFQGLSVRGGQGTVFTVAPEKWEQLVGYIGGWPGAAVETRDQGRQHPQASPFQLGHIYNRQQELHGVYGGQRYGGISTPTQHPYVFMFSGNEGAAFGYADEELPGGGLVYYGEGQVGDMRMAGGNLAIRDHAESGRTLHLFKKVRDGYVQYAGQFEYEGHELRADTPDRNRQLRTGIAFRLRPVDAAAVVVAPDVADASSAIRAIARGQGFSQTLTAGDRKAIELRAMLLAEEHFNALGFSVNDVSKNQPYDLRCTNGIARFDVEVKGTTTAGETVLLTPNEVQHALTNFPATALAIAHGIVLTGRGTPAVAASGGVLVVHQPWRPADTDLIPLGFSYTVPSNDG